MKDKLHTLPRRDFLRLGIVGGAGLMVGAACGELSRLGAPREAKAITDARQARKEALRMGQFKLPLPEWAKYTRITTHELPSYPSGSISILIIFVPSDYQDGLLPALIDGKVIEASQNSEGYSLDIKDGDQIWRFDGPGKLIATLGEDVTIGTPVADGLNAGSYFTISAYKDESGSQSWAPLGTSDVFRFDSREILIPTLSKPKR